MQCCYRRHNASWKSVKSLVVYQFYCMALFHSQTRCHMTKCINENTMTNLIIQICRMLLSFFRNRSILLLTTFWLVCIFGRKQNSTAHFSALNNEIYLELLIFYVHNAYLTPVTLTACIVFLTLTLSGIRVTCHVGRAKWITSTNWKQQEVNTIYLGATWCSG